MDAPNVDAAQVEQVLLAMNQLRNVVLFAILGTGVIVFGLWQFFTWFGRRSEIQRDLDIEESKNRRAAAFNRCIGDMGKTVERLGVMIEKHTDDEEHQTNNLASSMGDLSMCVASLDKHVKDLRDRQAGVINHTDSLRIIEDKFDQYVKHEVVRVFDYSLRQNDWDNRADAIRNRIKTEIGDILKTAQRAIGEYKLSVDTTPYFRTTHTERGIRFQLCDDLWDEVEGLYAEHGDVDQRAGEMRVIVANTIADAVAVAASQVNDIYRVAAAGADPSDG